MSEDRPLYNPSPAATPEMAEGIATAPAEMTEAAAAFVQARELVARLRAQLNGVVIGQNAVVDQVLIALLANGHVLIEGVPGLGKTLLVRALAACFDGDFKRIQFTPDLMPADITGHVLYDSNEGKFRMRKGPVFTNLLLADEINRAPAKTQAALLEVMQERQVTLEGSPHQVGKPFMVLATQNPIEQEGTYALPEAELDRFLMKIFIQYPELDQEARIAKLITSGHVDDQSALELQSKLLSAAEIGQLQQLVSGLAIDDQVVDYAVRLVRASRENPALARGAGIRASIALLRCARAHALLRGESFVLPDDVKAMVLPVMRHRIALSADMEIEGVAPDQILADIIDSVEAPRL